MSALVQVISILMKRERPVIYFTGNTGETLELGAFPSLLHLDFLFELNEVCMQAGRGGKGAERKHAGEGTYFIFPFKVLFSATLK